MRSGRRRRSQLTAGAPPPLPHPQVLLAPLPAPPPAADPPHRRASESARQPAAAALPPPHLPGAVLRRRPRPLSPPFSMRSEGSADPSVLIDRAILGRSPRLVAARALLYIAHLHTVPVHGQRPAPPGTFIQLRWPCQLLWQHLFSSGGPASCFPIKGAKQQKAKKTKPHRWGKPHQGGQKQKNTRICLKEKQRKAPSVCQSEKYAKVVRQSEKYAKRGKRY